MNTRQLLLLLAAALPLLGSSPRPRNADELHAMLCALPPAWVERDIEEPEKRCERLRKTAQALARFSRATQHRLIAKGYGETKFAAYTEWICDDVPDGASDCDGGLARTHWQLHAGACPQLWQPVRDPVAVGAGRAAARLEWAWRLCKGDPAKSFAAYGRGRCEATKNSTEKAAILRRLEAK